MDAYDVIMPVFCPTGQIYFVKLRKSAAPTQYRKLHCP